MIKSSAYIVVGLGYGDEGKGTTIEWLTRRHKAHTVVRFNGGGQAGHNIVRPDGKHHKFAQFGSGTFEGARTIMSRHTLVNPITALVEARFLAEKGVPDPLRLLTVEDEALITTPFHVSMGRMREMFRALTAGGRHGSCGMGIGETVEDSLVCDPAMVIRAGDLRDPDRLRVMLRWLQERKLAQLEDIGYIDCPTPQMDVELDILRDPSVVDTIMDHFHNFMRQVPIVGRGRLTRILCDPGVVLFEGAQGVLLDQDYGFHPHTTWSNCTFHNALDLIGDADIDVTRLGLVRSIQTKHGAGPFVTEDPSMLDLVEGIDHNKLDDWQGAFRVGALDLVATRYAVEACGGIDGLVVTWADVCPGKVCTAYETPDGDVFDRLILPHTIEAQAETTKLLGSVTPRYDVTRNVPAAAAEALGVPLALVSAGPTVHDKEDCDGIA